MQHASSSPTWRERAAGILRDQGILVAFVLLMVVMSLSIDRFATSENILAVIRQVSILGTIALGVTLSGTNLMTMDMGIASVLAVVPAIIGFYAGQHIRKQLSEALFRTLFYVALLVLGAFIAAKALLF